MFSLPSLLFKNVPDAGIELGGVGGGACIPGEHASDRATMPGQSDLGLHCLYIDLCLSENLGS